MAGRHGVTGDRWAKRDLKKGRLVAGLAIPLGGATLRWISDCKSDISKRKVVCGIWARTDVLWLSEAIHYYNFFL
jgi:hypothetical protein